MLNNENYSNKRAHVQCPGPNDQARLNSGPYLATSVFIIAFCIYLITFLTFDKLVIVFPLGIIDYLFII